MPKNLTGATGSFPTQTCPIGGEPRAAGGIETAFQNAADRTEHVKHRLYHVDPTKEGVRRIRSVASVTALQAVTDRPDGTVIEVAGVGLYRFDTTSVLAELSPLVIKPTAIIPADPGRWLVHGYGALDIANGIPTLDANARIATSKLASSGGGSKILGANVVNGLLDLFTSSSAGPHNTTSTTYVTVGPIEVSFTMSIGDRAIILGQAYGQQNDLTPAKHFTQWLVTKPDLSTAAIATSEIERKPGAVNEPEAIPIAIYFTATAAGLHKFVMQQKSEAASGGATVAIKNMNVIALLVRP
jgi:hypothetical protein